MNRVYVIYLLASVLLTVVVGQTLFRHGRPFLMQVFDRHVRMADSVNHLMRVGFYLVNIAIILLALHERQTVTTAVDSLELVSRKLGSTAVFLGVFHWCNLAAFCFLRDLLRRRSTIRATDPAGESTTG